MQEGAFYSVKRRNAFLADTTLSIVPTIIAGGFESAEQLKPLLDTPSTYRDGTEPVEGIVVRVDDDCDATGTVESGATAPAGSKGHLVRRGKFVRADFVQGIEDSGHWSKGALVKNIVVQ